MWVYSTNKVWQDPFNKCSSLHNFMFKEDHSCTQWKEGWVFKSCVILSLKKKGQSVKQNNMGLGKEFLFLTPGSFISVDHSISLTYLSSADHTGEEGYSKKITIYWGRGIFITQISHSDNQKRQRWMGERLQCLNHRQRTKQRLLRVGAIVFPKEKHTNWLFQ